jgi:hypothetical protein
MTQMYGFVSQIRDYFLGAASDTFLTRITRIFTKQFLKIRENSCNSCPKNIACSTQKIVSQIQQLRP